MENIKDSFVRWVKTHKRELAIAGISVGTLIAVVYLIKNPAAVAALWKSIKKIAKKTSATTKNIASVSSVPKTPSLHVPVEENVIEAIADTAKSVPHTQFDVSAHIRNLPKGWSASPEKMASALEYGYPLRPGQTWVQSYTKYPMAA